MFNMLTYRFTAHAYLVNLNFIQFIKLALILVPCSRKISTYNKGN